MPAVNIGEQEIHYIETGSGDTLLVLPDNLHSSYAYAEETDYFSDWSLDTREHYYTRNADSLLQQHGDDWRQVPDADTLFLWRIADRGGYALHDFVLNSITCPVLLTGNLHDALTPGIAGECARISAIIPDCSVYLAGRSGRRSGREHPFMWTDPDSFRTVSDMFLSKAQRAL